MYKPVRGDYMGRDNKREKDDKLIQLAKKLTG
jgi:hypothetical protein